MEIDALCCILGCACLAIHVRPIVPKKHHVKNQSAYFFTPQVIDKKYLYN